MCRNVFIIPTFLQKINIYISNYLQKYFNPYNKCQYKKKYFEWLMEMY